MIGGAKGIGIGIDFGIPNQYCRATSKPYIEKDVLDSLRVVASAYGKSNNNADRSIVKNLVDASNPFIISNAAFKLNSGFGEYKEDFTSWLKSIKITSFDSESFSFISDVSWILLYYKSNIGKDMPSFKVKIKLDGDGVVYYNYITQEGIPTNVTIKTEEFETPISYNTKYTGETPINVGFTVGVRLGECSGTITQVPSFEGAFVTDGIDDLITSTKTVQEMLGGSNEITVVSMAHFIKGESNAPEICRINQIRRDTRSIRNSISKIGKSGIFGYTYKNGVTTINNILGDKNDCTAEGNLDGIVAPFSVEGYYYNNNSNPLELCSIAWYWTIIANKVLTTDQINQVIAYFNLDRTLNPDILCNTIKQGITNENHAEFGDKLIDFSGNGRDIQLNNIAWKGDSGIGKYVEDFTTWYGATGVLQTFSKIEVTDGFKHNWVINRRSGESAINSFKVLIKGIPENGYIQYRYFESEDATKKSSIDIYEDGEYSLPNSTLNNLNDLVGFQLFAKIPPLDSQSFIGLTITQIPSHAGALCLDGVNDFGKVTGMPVYKDYTVVADYIRTSAKENAADSSILSKSKVINNGAFLFNYLNVSSTLNSYSFGTNNMLASISDSERKIYYQSKYVNEGKSINSGTGTDYDSMWLGTYRDNVQIFFNGAIYSLMSFPYSMSEFLIERQLKKHKLGTLYPNMVEFRPIVKSNLPYSSISYSVNPGEYISVDSMVTITITLPNTSDKLMEVSCNAISDISISGDNGVYEITGKVGKSPQKINMIISSYLTMLSNSTLISNETLIKNE